MSIKKILNVTSAPGRHWVGNGFPVHGMFGYSGPGVAERSPFLMLDYAAPYEFQPTTERRGVGQHPHRGFETVTIVYDGEVEHRDSTGNGGIIGKGDVQWMTAAGGILHEEFHSPAYAERGGPFEMVQLWVNLPKKDKMAPAGYQGILDAQIPAVALPITGTIAGATVFLLFAIHRLLHHPRLIAAGCIGALFGRAALLVLRALVLVALRLRTLVGHALLGIHTALFHALLIQRTGIVALLLLLGLPLRLLLPLLLALVGITLALLLLTCQFAPVFAALVVAAAREGIARHFNIAIATCEHG